MTPRTIIAALAGPSALIGAFFASTVAGTALVSIAAFGVLVGVVALGAGLTARMWAPGWPAPHSVRRSGAAAGAVGAFALAGLVDGMDVTVSTGLWALTGALFALTAGPRPARTAAGTRRDVTTAAAAATATWLVCGVAYAAMIDVTLTSVTAVGFAAVLIAALGLWGGPVLLTGAMFAGLLPPHKQERKFVLAVIRGWSRSWWGPLLGVAAGAAYLAANIFSTELPSRSAWTLVAATFAAIIAAGASVTLSESIRPRPVASDPTRLRTGKPQPWIVTPLAATVVMALALAPAAGRTPAEADPTPTPAAAAAPSDQGPAAQAQPASTFGPEFDSCEQVADYLAQKDCYADYFISVTDSDGIDAALDRVVEVHKDPSGETFRLHCHEVLHDIAIDAAGKAGDPTEMFAHFTVTCTGGFAHGVMLTWIATLDNDEFVDRIPTLCEDVVDMVVAGGKANAENTSWVQWNCDHSLGHIIYDEFRGDGPYDEARIVEGSKLCMSWPEPDTRWENCMAGYFMEQGLEVTRGDDSGNTDLRPTTTEEIFSLCLKVPEGVQKGCYSESGAANIAFHQGQFPPAFEACTEFAPEDMYDVCYEALGRMVTVYSGFKTEEMRATCNEVADDQARERCTMAYASGMVMELGATEGAERICNSEIEDPDRLAECLSRVRAVDAELDDSGFDGRVGEVTDERPTTERG